jgi:sugar lactone lactonase YvrE
MEAVPMSRHVFRSTLLLAAAAIATYAADTSTLADPNSAPDPYTTIENFFKMPEGRTWGSTSAIDVDKDGHIWVAERCGGNSCAESKLDPILEFDAKTGKMLKSFGGGMFIFPHGICVDKQGNIWVTDSQGREGKGHVAIKFAPEGKVLMTLGKPGEAGDGPDTFNEPDDVAVAPNGDIFVSDGHRPEVGNARVVKFTKDGKFIKQWGQHGSGPGQFEMPHGLAFDSKGRLFVADRGNNRIQIFDQEGKFIAEWHQFGRPSGVYIDKKDNIYVADSESQMVHAPAGGRGGAAGKQGKGKQGKAAAPGGGRGTGPLTTDYGYNEGFKRGMRIGSAKDGKVVAFIPDPQQADANGRLPATSAAEGVVADSKGNVYGAEVGPHDVKKYSKAKKTS